MTKKREPIARAQLLGTFQLFDMQGHVLLPRSRKAASLLAYLIHKQGALVSRDTAIDLFWSSGDTQLRRANLRQALAEIRKALGASCAGIVEFERSNLRAVTELIETDFLGTISAEALFRTDDFLTGIDPVAPVFDEWLEGERRWVRSQQIEALEQLLQPDVSAEARAKAAETLLNLEPENEMAAQAAIRAYGELNKRHQANKVFERISKALWQDDGLSVSPETERALESVMNTPLGAPATARKTGPPDVCIFPFSTLGQVSRDISQYLDAALLARLGDVREFRCSVAMVEDIRAAHALAPDARPDYFLSGSIGLEEGKFYCNVFLVSASTMHQVGSIRAQVEFVDPLVALTKIVDQIIAHSVPAIEGIEYQKLGDDQGQWTAYQSYVFAKTALNRAVDPGYSSTIEPYLVAAIAEDPELVVAYPILVSILNSRHRSTRPGLFGEQEKDSALELAKRGLVKDATFANTHIAKAWCLMRRREFDLAEQAVIEALRFNPYEASRLNSVGSIYVLLGDHERGAEFYERAREVQFNDLDFQNTDLGELHYFRRDYEQAVSYLSLGETRNPTYARVMKAAALAQLGNLLDAQKAASVAINELRERWASAEAFSLSLATRWFLDDFPLRRQADYDNLVEGLAKAGFQL